MRAPQPPSQRWGQGVLCSQASRARAARLRRRRGAGLGLAPQQLGWPVDPVRVRAGRLCRRSICEGRGLGLGQDPVQLQALQELGLPAPPAAAAAPPSRVLALLRPVALQRLVSELGGAQPCGLQQQQGLEQGQLQAAWVRGCGEADQQGPAAQAPHLSLLPLRDELPVLQPRALLAAPLRAAQVQAQAQVQAI